MTSTRFLTAAVLLLLPLAAPAAAAPAPSSRVDVGVAGTLPFMKGAGAEVGWVPSGTRIRPNLSAFTVEVPVALLGDNDGWSRRDAGVALGVDYLFGSGARGFFVGSNVT